MTDDNIADRRAEFLSPLAISLLDSHRDAYCDLIVRGSTPESAQSDGGHHAGEIAVGPRSQSGRRRRNARGTVALDRRPKKSA